MSRCESVITEDWHRWAWDAPAAGGLGQCRAHNWWTRPSAPPVILGVGGEMPARCTRSHEHCCWVRGGAQYGDPSTGEGWRRVPADPLSRAVCADTDVLCRSSCPPGKMSGRTAPGTCPWPSLQRAGSAPGAKDWARLLLTALRCSWHFLLLCRRRGAHTGQMGIHTPVSLEIRAREAALEKLRLPHLLPSSSQNVLRLDVPLRRQQVQGTEPATVTTARKPADGQACNLQHI